MEKTPTYLKLISVLGLLSGIVGIVVAFKIPGTIALAPLFIGLVLGIIAFIIAKNKKAKCYGSIIALIVAVVGIALTIIMHLTRDPEVVVDEKQEKTLEQTNEDIVEGDDLDNALDDLLMEDDSIE